MSFLDKIIPNEVKKYIKPIATAVGAAFGSKEAGAAAGSAADAYFHRNDQEDTNNAAAAASNAGNEKAAAESRRRYDEQVARDQPMVDARNLAMQRRQHLLGLKRMPGQGSSSSRSLRDMANQFPQQPSPSGNIYGKANSVLNKTGSPSGSTGRIMRRENMGMPTAEMVSEQGAPQRMMRPPNETRLLMDNFSAQPAPSSMGGAAAPQDSDSLLGGGFGGGGFNPRDGMAPNGKYWGYGGAELPGEAGGGFNVSDLATDGAGSRANGMPQPYTFDEQGNPADDFGSMTRGMSEQEYMNDPMFAKRIQDYQSNLGASDNIYNEQLNNSGQNIGDINNMFSTQMDNSDQNFSSIDDMYNNRSKNFTENDLNNDVLYGLAKKNQESNLQRLLTKYANNGNLNSGAAVKAGASYLQKDDYEMGQGALARFRQQQGLDQSAMTDRYGRKISQQNTDYGRMTDRFNGVRTERNASAGAATDRYNRTTAGQAANYGAGNEAWNKDFQRTGRELSDLQSMSGQGQTASSGIGAAGADSARTVGGYQSKIGDMNAAAIYGNGTAAGKSKADIINTGSKLLDLYNKNGSSDYTPIYTYGTSEGE